MGSYSSAKRKWPSFQFKVGFHMESYCTYHQHRDFSHDDYYSERFGEKFSLRLSETVAVRVMYKEHKLHTTLRGLCKGTEQNLLMSIPEEDWKVYKMPYRWMTNGGWQAQFTDVVDVWESEYLASKESYDDEARGQPSVPHRHKTFKSRGCGWKYVGMAGGPKIHSAFSKVDPREYAGNVRRRWSEYHKAKWRAHYAREREWKS